MRRREKHAATGFCSKCGYQLDGLGEEQRCPECGQPFYACAPVTYRLRPPGGLRALRWLRPFGVTRSRTLQRYCLHCAAPIVPGEESRCARCGREFYLSDPSTYALRRPASRGWVVAASCIAAFPALLTLVVYAAWAQASIALGRTAVANVDHATAGGPGARLLEWVADLLVMSSVLLLPLSALGLVYVLSRTRVGLGRHARLRVCLLAGLWLFLLLLLVTDPCGALA